MSSISVTKVCKNHPRGETGGLSRECALRIPMRVVKGD